MAILIKPGVTFAYAPAGMRILEVLKRATDEVGVNIVITSGSDGMHSGPTDPHHTGEAYDIRTHDFAPQTKGKVLDYLKVHLGTEFFAFVEAPGTGNEHIHVQMKKGTKYSIEQYLKAGVENA